jgi:enamine deaminase RidA (YjgF/YER057c/UK114 family)
MAALGGMLAAAILKVVGDQIGSVIGGQIKLHKNFNKDLKKMKLALESVDALLEDAGRRSVTDKSTLLWLKRLTDAMYAISDMIDEFEADAEAVSQPSARKVRVRYSKPQHLKLTVYGHDLVSKYRRSAGRGEGNVETTFLLTSSVCKCSAANIIVACACGLCSLSIFGTICHSAKYHTNND